jgi:signal recognition particle subunit SRP54
MLDRLGSSLKSTLKKIAGAVFVNEKLIDELVKDIQRALLSADVNVKLVFSLTKQIKQRALNEKTPATITKKEHLVNIVYEELVKFLGEEKSEIKIEKKKPFKIMMVGLYGSGKSTSCQKISKYYSKRGYKVAAVGLDVYRPGAMDQLQQLCDKIKIKCFVDKKEKDPLKIYKKYEKEIKEFDLLLIDTSGRDALSKELINEIEKLNDKIKPDENLLVINADIGQAAESQAKQFHESCGITGIFVTKMDGTGKAGGSLSACSATGAKVKFIGVGEKEDDIEVFNPTGFVSRLLGMGDLEALLEKSKEALEGVDAESLKEKIEKGDFSLIDLYDQLKAMKKMGPLSKVIDMIPGMGNVNLPKELVGVQEGKLKKWKFIMDSCTKYELEHPEEITRTRIERIAKGSGSGVGEVRELLKQYKQSKKMMKMMKGMGNEKDMSKLMKKFKGKMKI